MGPDSEKSKKVQRGFPVAVDDLPADLDTPVSAYLKLRPAGARFLLESAESGGALGRHSFIGFGNTFLTAQADGEVDVSAAAAEETAGNGNPLAALRDMIGATVLDCPQETYLLGGAVGFVSYDYVRLIERLGQHHPCRQPLCQFVLVDSLLAFDHLKRRAAVMSLAQDKQVEEAQKRNREIRTALASLPPEPGPGSIAAVEFTSNTSREKFEEMVRTAKQYIRAGDAFQIVLSRRVDTEISVDPFQFYRALRMINPSPYMFYLDFGKRKIIGSSPEMLVKLTGRRADISPIAGTRPRGRTPEEDEALAGDLLADEKECAEHIMLVDLARNDLGRCCRYGSVRVERLMKVEKYSHVQHIVSDVHGQMRDEFDQYDLLRASFPAGTVSGAPKVRAMEIIDELEKDSRGIYAGCVGYFSPDGNMDSCITIRTIVVEDGRASLQAGAGIVADSDPAREFVETENKLAALKEAIVRAQEGKL